MAQTAEQKAKIQALLAKLQSKKVISPAALEQATADVAKADNIDLSNIIGNKTLDDEAAAEAVENVLEAAYGTPPSAAEQPGPPNIFQPEQEPEQEPEQPACVS
jgi:hypothetical protein